MLALKSVLEGILEKLLFIFSVNSSYRTEYATSFVLARRKNERRSRMKTRKAPIFHSVGVVEISFRAPVLIDQNLFGRSHLSELDRAIVKGYIRSRRGTNVMSITGTAGVSAFAICTNNIGRPKIETVFIWILPDDCFRALLSILSSSRLGV